VARVKQQQKQILASTLATLAGLARGKMKNSALRRVLAGTQGRLEWLEWLEHSSLSLAPVEKKKERKIITITYVIMATRRRSPPNQGRLEWLEWLEWLELKKTQYFKGS
jgi:hypothetical protein